MSNILNSLLAEARKPEIPFGIHENCRITKIHRGEKKKGDGTIIKLNGFTTFTQFNEKNKPLAEKEVSWFNIDTTNEWAQDNFVTQMEQMVGILLCYYTREELEESFNFPEKNEIESTTEFEEAFEDKKLVAAMHETMLEQYFDLLEEKIGKDSDLVRLKMVFDKTGRNLQAPKYGVFVEPLSISAEDSKLSITDKETQAKVQSTATVTKKGADINNI